MKSCKIHLNRLGLKLSPFPDPVTSEPAELISLQAIGIKTIELNYKEFKKEDKYGNYFRYRAMVKDEHGAQAGRWAWDVFLVCAK
jgi:hypothetical protein